VFGWRELVKQVRDLPFDALAIHSPIEVPRQVALDYYRKAGVNPWGGVEAIASKLISNELNKPVAHAPLESVKYEDRELYTIFSDERLDPRICPEAISNCYLHSVLKGLHRAPLPVDAGGINAVDVDWMVAPARGCWGPAHDACALRGIPIIFVSENKTVAIRKQSPPPGWSLSCREVNNYWEAAGVVMSMWAEITPESVRRPFPAVEVKAATP